MQISKRSVVLLVMLQVGFFSSILYMGVEMFGQQDAHKKKMEALKKERDFQVKRFLKRHFALSRKSCQAYMKKRWKDLYNKVWNIHPPCDKHDKIRKVYQVDGLGRFCIEPHTRDVIKARLRSNKLWEGSFLPYFKKYIRKGSVVLDVGAHIGAHTLALSKYVGPKGTVHAFEPQLKLYQELLVNMDLNQVKNVYAHFAAVGDSHTRVSMSFPASDNEGGTDIGQGGNRVELRTLDSYGFKNVSFLKLDVEGFEPFVLKGARQMLERNKPVILIELLDYNKKYKERKAMSLKLLKQLGYTQFLPVPPKPIHNYLVLHQSYGK